MPQVDVVLQQVDADRFVLCVASERVRVNVDGAERGSVVASAR